jgi:hypothetical protein
MLREFFIGVPRVIVGSFSGFNILSHALAITVTIGLVFSGIDWKYSLLTDTDVLRPIIMLAGLGGFLVPIFLPVALWLIGFFQKDRYMVRSGWAVAQAAAVAWLISVTYKAFTGRIEPNGNDGIIDISRNFQFGFWEHGIFWGWPSSHTCVAFAVSITLVLLYRSRALRFVALMWAAIVAFGASVGFHWLSDMIAGAIIGTVVGTVVARHFRSSEQKTL